jgi:ASPM-SPD-2-Hydin domain-containing protein
MLSPSRSGHAALATCARDQKRAMLRPQRWLSVAVALVMLGMLATTAEAAAPAVTLTPTSLTFASQAIGTTSAPQSITVSNSGTANLFINSAAVPNTLDFTVVDDECSGLTLAPGTGCSMSITFSPSATGTRSAAFTVTDNAANSPQTAPITGTGTGTNPPLAINTQFFTCSGGVCDEEPEATSSSITSSRRPSRPAAARPRTPGVARRPVA